MRTRRVLSLTAVLSLTSGLLGGTAFAAEPTVDFNRDIRPILSDTCFVCHGPDATTRPTELRFDLSEIATSKLESGVTAIVPGKPAESELVARITSDDELMQMPPADFKRQLTPREVELLTKWIAEGAEYQQHWSFIPPERPPLPAVSQPAWVRNPIDGFVLKRLDEAGLKPSEEAEPETLLRRATFDLTGLPPTLYELDSFLSARGADAPRSPGAYERQVDRLLASPRYGEHQARYWLDAARYGDTHGLHLDNLRSMYPFRTWVIRAFNENKPFDEFTIEQIAGDLLPNPTLDQTIATGFNRCNVTTSEGGAIDEEFRVRYAIDRTETIGTVWMGLTVGCAVCHDHKFDPISQKEFYRLYAYYNSTADKAMDGNALLPPPSVKVPTAYQKQRKGELDGAIAAEEQSWRDFVASLPYGEPPSADSITLPTEREEFVWVDDALPPNAKPEASGDEGATGWRWVGAPEHPVFSGNASTIRHARANKVAQHLFTGADPLSVGEGDVLFAHVYIDPADPPKQIMLQFNDGDWEQRAYWGENNRINFGKDGTPSRFRVGDLPAAGQWIRVEVPAASVGLAAGTKLNGLAFTQAGGTVYWDKAGIVTANAARLASATALAAWESAIAPAVDKLPEAIRTLLAVAEKDRTAEQRDALLLYFESSVHDRVRDRLKRRDATLTPLKGELAKLESEIPSTLVMQEAEELREAFILVRGEYDKHGDPVKPGVPAALPPLKDDAPPNRLALARWLVDPHHPLTARVTVNRIWQHYFGIGLVETTGDFGAQGAWPSHPDLLDWLAVEFVESGWNVKHVHRLIVTSATYRQSSVATPDRFADDPENRLLARGPRFRLGAETIRDAALAVSGLLVETIGGESVKPYQPPGLWEAVGFTSSNTVNFVQDHGEDLYRRGLYTFWKRTAPPPMLQAFDAPSREQCTVDRPTTNTPLQALSLMNDTQFVEAARLLAARMMTEGGTAAGDRLAYGFRLVTSRRPNPDETALLLKNYESHLAQYRDDAEAATKLLTVGESPRDESLDPAEHAAMTMTANLLLNLDEAVTKE
ncbi:MAG: PSD1 and planctomycete cytochrome C domain-containing protein [Planctomycetaceae bacterium]